MKNKAFKILKLLRPKQWIKNFAVFAPILFTGELFDFPVVSKVVLAFIIFCGLSSSIYVINDIFDIKKDRMHPFKRFRPLAHNDLSVSFAVFIAIALAVVSIFLGFYLSGTFFLTTLVYLLLQFSYSMYFKHIAVIDILSVASGYILRVYAGEFASGFHISVWLLLTTVAFSLLLATGKRKAELTLISNFSEDQRNTIRKTLSHYSDRLLDVYASMFATATFLAYTFFTFFENPQGIKISNSFLLPDFLPQYFQRKWLMITILPVIYALMRYLQDIYEKHEGESPEKLYLSDIPLLASSAIWLVLVIIIIYFVKG